MRYRLDRLSLENSQICLPAIEFGQWVVIGTGCLRSDAGAGRDASKHAADRGTIQRASVNGDADNPARILSYDDHHSVRFQDQ